MLPQYTPFLKTKFTDLGGNRHQMQILAKGRFFRQRNKLKEYLKKKLLSPRSAPMGTKYCYINIFIVKWSSDYTNFCLDLDSPCRSFQGVCQLDTYYCRGRYVSGLCGGPYNRRCCIPSQLCHSLFVVFLGYWWDSCFTVFKSILVYFPKTTKKDTFLTRFFI